ncbi:MAG: hypothetical protein AAF447_07095 [Myxococcota bacterium]
MPELDRVFANRRWPLAAGLLLAVACGTPDGPDAGGDSPTDLGAPDIGSADFGSADGGSVDGGSVDGGGARDLGPDGGVPVDGGVDSGPSDAGPLANDVLALNISPGREGLFVEGGFGPPETDAFARFAFTTPGSCASVSFPPPAPPGLDGGPASLQLRHGSAVLDVPFSAGMGEFTASFAGTFSERFAVVSAPYRGVGYAVDLAPFSGPLPLTSAWAVDGDLGSAPADLAVEWDVASVGTATHVSLLATALVEGRQRLISCIEPVATGRIAVSAGTVPAGSTFLQVGIAGVVHVTAPMTPAGARVDAVIIAATVFVD